MFRSILAVSPLALSLSYAPCRAEEAAVRADDNTSSPPIVVFGRADLPGPWEISTRVRHLGPSPLTEDNSVRTPGSTAGARLGRLSLVVEPRTLRLGTKVNY